MSHPWYHTTRWRTIAKAQLKAEPLCALHERLGRIVPATIADHVEPHHGDYEKFWHGRLQSLCATCHSKHKQTQEKSGKLPGCDVNGQPIDSRHHWRQ